MRREGRHTALQQLPDYLKSLKAQEEHYLGMVTLMEDLASQERRKCVRAETDAKAARQAARNLADACKRQQIEDLHARVARDEEAAFARRRGCHPGFLSQVRHTIGQGL